jgi:uncharacterized membrane protein
MDFSQLVGTFLPFLESVPVIRVVLGFIIVFLLPGFAWTFVFFKRINNIERIALSFGLSIALVTLSIIALNMLLGMRINGTNALVTIIVITIIALVIYLIKRLLTRRSEAPDED